MNTAVNPASLIYGVPENQIAFCKSCNGKVIWQQSFRTGGKYPTDVKISDGSNLPAGTTITARNWFHKCPVPAPQQLQLLVPPPVPIQPPAQPAVYSPIGTSQAAKYRAMEEFLDKATEPQLRSALKTIFDRQTNAEQRSDMTRDQNNIGFGSADAEICSNIYKGAVKYNGLRGKQVDLIRRKMKKYRRQLVAALELGEWTI